MEYKVGNYYLGQNVNEAEGLEEFSQGDYRNNPIRRVFGDERLYHGAPIYFGNCYWNLVTVGVIKDKIYKIGLNLSDITENESMKRVENLKQILSKEIGHEPQKSLGQLVWYLESSEICLTRRGLFGFNVINLIFTSRNIFQGKSRTETLVLFFKHVLDYIKTIWKSIF